MADVPHTEETPLNSQSKSEEATESSGEKGGQPIKDAPPKYEKFVPGLASTKEELEKCGDSKTGQVTAVIKGIEICCGSVIVTIIMLILSALPVAMIVIGSVYLHDCPRRDKIPIWLIVFGVFSLFQTIVNGMRRCTESIRETTSSDEEGSKKPSAANRGGGCCEGLISLFLFAWLIVGSVWVFGYWTTYNSAACSTREDCCHPVPYMFSFVTLIVMYAVGALSILIACCCCCCMGCYLFATGDKDKMTSCECE